MTVEGHIDLRELAGWLARRRRGRTEATVQSDVPMLLLASGLNLTEGDVLDVELEAPPGDRREEHARQADTRPSLGSAPHPYPPRTSAQSRPLVWEAPRASALEGTATGWRRFLAWVAAAR